MTLTAEGLEIPSLQELLDRRAALQRASIDPLLANTGDSVLGNLNGIEASHDREAYEAIQIVASAINPDNAEGALLDGVCAITGTLREGQTATRFSGTRKLVVNLDDGAIITGGVTTFAVTAAPSIEFVADATFENDTGINNDFEISATCTTLGPIVVNANTVTTVVTSTPGLVSVNNPTDAITGDDVETDEALRARRERELRQIGSSTVPGLTADLQAIEDEDGNNPVLSAVVLENYEDYWVSYLPPHSFAPIIWDGLGQDADDDAVSAVIATNRPPGIKSIGTEGTAPNQWSRATQSEFEVELTLRVSSAYAGDDAVKAAVALRAASLVPRGTESGSGVVAYSAFLDAALHVAGVNRVTLIRMRFASGAWVSHTDLTPDVGAVGVTSTGSVTVLTSVGL